jgi:hypothetical protein
MDTNGFADLLHVFAKLTAKIHGLHRGTLLSRLQTWHEEHNLPGIHGSSTTPVSRKKPEFKENLLHETAAGISSPSTF